MAQTIDFASRCKGLSRGPRAGFRVGWIGAAENRWSQPLLIRTVCRPIALSKAEARAITD